MTQSYWICTYTAPDGSEQTCLFNPRSPERDNWKSAIRYSIFDVYWNTPGMATEHASNPANHKAYKADIVNTLAREILHIAARLAGASKDALAEEAQVAVESLYTVAQELDPGVLADLQAYISATPKCKGETDDNDDVA
jgi:hypothetical protein